MPILSPEYLAGYFDGEGCISVYAVPNQRNSYYMQARIAQVDPEVLNYLKEKYGGSLYRSDPSKTGRRPFWQWQVAGKRAVPFLEDILPFLVHKKLVVMLALFMMRNRRKRGQARGPDDIGEYVFANVRACNSGSGNFSRTIPPLSKRTVPTFDTAQRELPLALSG